MSDITMQLQLEAGTTVASGAPVLFDQIVSTVGSIGYNPGTGVITLQEPGLYVFEWWVATQSSTVSGSTAFSLNFSGSGAVQGESPVKAGQLSGFGFVEVTVPPVTVTLTNATPGTIYFPNSAIRKAGLLVTGYVDITAFGMRMSDEAFLPLTGTPQIVPLDVQSVASENVSFSAADSVTIEQTGIYRVEIFISGTLSGATQLQNVYVSLAIDGVEETALSQQLEVGPDTGTVTFALMNYLPLSAGEVLTVVMSTAPDDLSFFFPTAGNGAMLSVQRVL